MKFWKCCYPSYSLLYKYKIVFFTKWRKQFIHSYFYSIYFELNFQKSNFWETAFWKTAFETAFWEMWCNHEKCCKWSPFVFKQHWPKSLVIQNVVDNTCGVTGQITIYFCHFLWCHPNSHTTKLVFWKICWNIFIFVKRMCKISGSALSEIRLTMQKLLISMGTIASLIL